MTSERIRQAVVGLTGLLFVGLVYPLASDLLGAHWLVGMHGNEIEPMFLSFFISLGAFLLLAARKPWEYRFVIAFAGVWNLFHGAVMAVESVEAWNRGVHRQWADVIIVTVLGVVLLAITPRTSKRAAPTREAVAAVSG